MPEPTDTLTHSYLTRSDVRLHRVEAGEGPAVLLLHGFPEFWYSWRHHIPPFARAGYHVIAPDLRGFGDSDAPPDPAAYSIETLVEDVSALIASSGQACAHLVGHDWGGLIAWCVAAWRPDLVRSLTILNAPHPTIYRRVLWRSPQWLRSAYVPVFMAPGLAERLLLAHGGWLIKEMFRRGAAHRDAVPPDAIRRYVEEARRPGRLTGGLNYYRANAHLGFRGVRLPRITAPTLVLWGDRDPALGVNLLDGLDDVVNHPHVQILRGVGHWVAQEAPDVVTTSLLQFWSSHGAMPSSEPTRA